MNRAPDRRARVVTALVTIGVVGWLAGCGSSSKPAYCSAITDLENSIKALPSTNVVASGTNGLKSAISKVEDNVLTVVDTAEGEFPNETSALKSSIDSLKSTVESLVKSPSAATVAQIPGEVSAVVTSIENFRSATKAKCG